MSTAGQHSSDVLCCGAAHQIVCPRPQPGAAECAGIDSGSHAGGQAPSSTCFQALPAIAGAAGQLLWRCVVLSLPLSAAQVGTAVVTRQDKRLALGRLGSLVEQIEALVSKDRQVILVRPPTASSAC